jgi:hypothetical protein
MKQMQINKLKFVPRLWKATYLRFVYANHLNTNGV